MSCGFCIRKWILIGTFNLSRANESRPKIPMKIISGETKTSDLYHSAALFLPARAALNEPAAQLQADFSATA